MRRTCLTVLLTILGVSAASVSHAADLTPPSSQALPGHGAAPLGVWRADCSSGIRLSSMPNAWEVSQGQPVTIRTRLAVDFEKLTEDQYEVNVTPDGERVYQLTGFTMVFLQADVRASGSAQPIATLSGARLSAGNNEPATLTWRGVDRQGRPVPPGTYEIEVRGRVMPAWAERIMGREGAYADIEGWNETLEACTRSIRIEVLPGGKRPVDMAPQGISCAPAPASYYATVDTSSPAALRASLHAVIDDHVRFPYTSSSTDTWDILNDADENPANPSTVLDLYKNTTFPKGCSGSCAWNREHTWAKSFGFQTESGSAATPYTDTHHLRATDNTYNSSRSNLPHGMCTSGCTTFATDVNNGYGGSGQVNRGTGGSIACTTPSTGQVWETWDHRKGDVARSILYMDIRYEGGTGPLGAEPNLIATDDLSLMYAETTSCGDGYMPVAYHGILSDLLAWHDADPPDADEMRRNDQVWCYQQNRNPFVDHPEWVDCLYRGNCSGGGTLSFAGIQTATDSNSCSATGVTLGWAVPSAWNDGCTSGCSRGFRVMRNGTAVTSGGCAAPLAATTTSCVDTTGTAGTTYTYSVQAFNHQGATSTGGASLSATDRTNDGTAPVITAGPTATAGSTTSFTVAWTTDEPSDSRLEYGLTTAYGSTSSNATMVTSHSITVTGLTAGTTYNFRAGSTDACGTGPRWSSNGTVTTQSGGGTGTPLAINGFKLTQANATYNYTLPAGTSIPANGYLVIARSADKAAFEAYWGVTLGSQAAFLNSAGTMPVINGSETYTLANASGTVIDGPTIAMGASAAQSVRRNDPCLAAGTAASWTVGAVTTATAGSGAGTGCGKGVVINEFSDASDYNYEFIELHYDAPGGDTTAPVTSITSPASGATVSGTVSVTASASDATGVTKVEFFLDGSLQSTDTASPYSWSWATTGATNASHTLTSKAYDAAGNVGTSAAISVTVSNDTTAPVTSITAPASGATVSGTVSVTASASDATGVTKVEFFLDGSLQSTDTASPYSWSWATTGATNGSHTLTSKAYDAAGNVGTSANVSVTVSNDTTAPVTSITAPASGATVSGTVSVTASASDATGVTKVEFYLDGTLQSTDTASPYSWSWATTLATNASHTLTSKAYDAAGNVGTSANVTVTVSNGTGTNVGGWRVVQANSAITYTIPAGTVIPANGYLVIGRNATKTAFQTFWKVTLATNVVYLSGGDSFPQINGSENYTLYNASGTKVDGATVSMSSSAAQSLQRKDPCNSAGTSTSWTIGASTAGTPGRGAGTGCAGGVKINEFSDATGTGNHIYEFVELHADN